jgi:hypothetical protein
MVFFLGERDQLIDGVHVLPLTKAIGELGSLGHSITCRGRQPVSREPAPTMVIPSAL